VAARRILPHNFSAFRTRVNFVSPSFIIFPFTAEKFSLLRLYLCSTKNIFRVESGDSSSERGKGKDRPFEIKTGKKMGGEEKAAKGENFKVYF
jgi:hypothetical protein